MAVFFSVRSTLTAGDGGGHGICVSMDKIHLMVRGGTTGRRHAVRRCSGWRGFPMHGGQEGAKSVHVLPQTQDVGLQCANVASHKVIDGAGHRCANPRTASVVLLWAAAFPARAAIVATTSAVFLALAASRVDTLSCVRPMSTMSDARSDVVAIAVAHVAVAVARRSRHESLRSAHETRRAATVNRVETTIKLAMEVCQSLVGKASLLHECLPP